jgi:hypothetical protein
MKKVLLLSLSLVLGFSAFAQRVVKNDAQAVKVDSKKVIVGNEAVTESAAQFAPQSATSVVVNRYDNAEDCATMVTNYDLQSNSWCANRMYQLPNGSVGVVATLSHQTNQSASDRGTGYNFYNADNDEWLDQPEARIEDVRTGWPTIAQWGDNGEILIAHTPLRVYTREVAGEGAWVFRGVIPNAPAEYPYEEDAAWPRVATTGEHHNIIHVIADLQHSGDVVEHHQVYMRSEDAENWTVTYSPLAQDGEETGGYSADSYNISAYGHTVAIIYADDLQRHVVMYKSTDDGLTWTRRVVWENPYYGYDWSDPASIYSDTMHGPANVAIAVGPNGVVHVALTAYEYIHSEVGDTYTTWRGRTVDGVCYWNDTQAGPLEAPDGNPHHAMMLWWPDEENPGYVKMHADSTKWIGYVPLYVDDNGNIIPYENDMFYIENDYFYKMRSGQSAMPALSIDPMGNMACAWSAPCSRPDEDGQEKYFRHIYVSYYNVDEGYWHQVEDELSDPTVDFSYSSSENIFTFGVDQTANPGEFWFGYQTDYERGLYWGSEATQTSATDNDIHVVKVIANPEFVSVPENSENEAKDVIYGIYPNPATDYVIVNSAMNTEASITIFNLVGQAVKQFNKDLKLGENVISLDLTSGIYFCNINANGFNKTVKFIVK